MNNTVKVQARYIVPAEPETIGRTAWIVRSDDELAMGNIYKDEGDAAVLTLDELRGLYEKPAHGVRLIITRVLVWDALANDYV